MTDRDAALDFVKGFLVIVMVVYHTLNYFAAVDDAVYGALRFVNGSFVFLAGFSVSLVYAQRIAQAPEAVARRLRIRGLKLLAVFTALNLLAAAAGMRSYKQVDFGIAGFFANAFSTYVTGDSPVMAFRILMPIAYTLMLAPIYLAAGRARPLLVGATLVAAALYMAAAPFAPNVFFLLLGLTGLCAGMAVSGRTLPAMRNPLLIVPAAVLLCAAMNWLSGNVLGYALGIALLLKCVQDGAALLRLDRPLAGSVVRLGRYSLVGYILQIGVLFLAYKALGAPRWPPGPELALVMVSVTLLLVAACAALELLRKHYRWANSAYSLVFA